MPTWGDILAELTTSPNPAGPGVDFDSVRRKYLRELHERTQRNTVLYASNWLNSNTGAAEASISLADVQALMEVFKDLPGPSLDLILHSLGGSPEATASLVRYMRSKYSDVRVFVPLAAMSAATMWALAGNRIVMGKHSQLGPIDPQLVWGSYVVPARALKEQFARAQRECADDPRRLSAWLPILQQYGPGLLEQAEEAEQLARELVEQWLSSYMLAEVHDAGAKARQIASYFASAELHHSHSMGISREMARARGVVIDDLEEDQALQDAVLSVHHAVNHTFGGTSAVKIVETHIGKSYVSISAQVAMQVPAALAPRPMPAPLAG